MVTEDRSNRTEQGNADQISELAQRYRSDYINSMDPEDLLIADSIVGEERKKLEQLIGPEWVFEQ